LRALSERLPILSITPQFTKHCHCVRRVYMCSQALLHEGMVLSVEKFQGRPLFLHLPREVTVEVTDTEVHRKVSAVRLCTCCNTDHNKSKVSSTT
jgi:hypothetical protein